MEVTRRQFLELGFLGGVGLALSACGVKKNPASPLPSQEKKKITAYNSLLIGYTPRPSYISPEKANSPDFENEMWDMSKITNYFCGLNDNWSRDEINKSLSDGKIPMISLDVPDGTFNGIEKYKDKIISNAEFIGSLGKPVMVRFGYEMNLDWLYRKKLTPQIRKQETAHFVNAWGYFAKIMREKAPNAILVWSPNVDNDSSYPFEEFYPGDEYVDICGFDVYYKQEGKKSTFKELFQSSYDAYRRISRKPFIITELGYQFDPNRSEELNRIDVSNWLNTAFRDASDLGAQAIVLFTENKKVAGNPYEDDWGWNIRDIGDVISFYQRYNPAFLDPENELTDPSDPDYWKNLREKLFKIRYG